MRKSGTGEEIYIPRDGKTLHGGSFSGRQRIVAYIGVQTGFNDPGVQDNYNYMKRRAVLRETWFPADVQALDRLQQELGLVVRFVIGHSKNAAQESSLAQEEERHGAFLRLDLLVRLLWISKIQGSGGTSPSMACWETPTTSLTAGAPSTCCLAGQPHLLLAWDPSALRYFSNEDVTIGAWMLALNVTHYDDRRLCERDCSPSSVAVFDMPKCAGLCQPITGMAKLFKDPACQGNSIPLSEADLPLQPSIIWFRDL
eukprot:jgi/Botrbrau1/16028/Bobra.7_2s0003.1